MNRHPLPRIEPQLPTLAGDVPAGTDWVHEIKWDGQRVVAYLDGDGVRLLSRTGKDWAKRFARVATALQAMAKGRAMILDGEVAAPDENGVTHGVSDVLRGDPDRLVFFAFDLMWLDDEDLREDGLLQRKRRLKALLQRVRGPILYSEHVAGDDGRDLYGAVVRAGGEGIVSKRKHAHYVSGRSTTWLKVKPEEVKSRQLEALRKSVESQQRRRVRTK